MEEKFNLAKKSLISQCKQSVSKNHNRFFDMWLRSDADMEFGHGYQDIFKSHFGDKITPEIEGQLWFAGKHIIYAIKSFIFLKVDYYIDELLEFVDKFVTEQLDEFKNDYDVDDWFDDEETDDDPIDMPTQHA